MGAPRHCADGRLYAMRSRDWGIPSASKRPGKQIISMPYRPPIHKPASGDGPTRRLAHDRWRGSAASRGYDGPWRALREAKLKADPLCWWCELGGVLTPATTVDHIRPISLRPDLRLVWSNLRSGCKPCHDAHTAHQVADGHRGMRGVPKHRTP